MSYIRSGWPLRHVKAESKDYIYPTSFGGDSWVEDHGMIHDTTIVEFVCRALREGYRRDDKEFVEYVISKLSGRLQVPLRKKPLRGDEQVARMSEKVKQTSNILTKEGKR